MRHAAELTGAAAAVAARAVYAALRRNPPAGAETWSRTNHRGEPVTLLEGPAVAIGAITAELGSGALARWLAGSRLAGSRLATPGSDPERSRAFAASAAISLAGAGALGFGVLDDLKGSANRRGLRGHLAALKDGEVTTGTIKLAGLAATGVAASAVLASGGAIPPRPPLRMGGQPPISPRGGLHVPPFPAGDILINAGLVAGGANLLNLFDLRPGRAIKVATLSAGIIAAAGATPAGPPSTAGIAAVAAPVGAGLALLPEDLAERAMLGDAGANALGAMLGAAAAVSLPRPARAGLLAALVTLTVVSEKVSFTKVIEHNPALRWLDMLGRRPASPPGKHRRVRQQGSTVRSAEWVFRPLKIATRQEP